MAKFLLDSIPVRQTDDNGDPVPGALLYTYAAGTSTPQATYTNSGGGTPLANPIVADGDGYWPATWIGPDGYKLVARKPDATLLWERDNVTAQGNADSILFDPGMTGDVDTTVERKLRERRSVWDFGASATASASVNAVAFQAAIDAVGASGGGIVYVPYGNYSLSAVLTVNYDDVVIEGDGGSAQNITETGSTILTATHVLGPVIRIKKPGCGVCQITLTADATRQAAAYTTNNHGIWVEATDAASQSVKRQKFHDLRITQQPAAGLVLIGDILNTDIQRLDIDQNGSHGLVVNGGGFTSRVNVDRPGQLLVSNFRTSRNGGHGVLIGDASNLSGSRPYRISLEMGESFYNCQTSAAKLADYDWYLYGENIDLLLCATGGETADTVPDHGGLYINGRNIAVENHRFVDCDPYAAYVDDRDPVNFNTVDVSFELLYINNANAAPGFYNPAIFCVSTCENIHADTSTNSSDVVSLLTPSVNYSENFRDTHRFRGYQVSGSFNSAPSALSLADDFAGYWSLSQAASYGIAMISGNLAAAGVIFAFVRVDASANVTVISSTGPTIDVTTGPLANGGGVDTRLTLSADSATNRLYISNRLGTTRSYNLSFIASEGYVMSSTNL